MSVPFKSDSIVIPSGGAADPKLVTGTVDPVTTGQAAPEGSLFLRYVSSNGRAYVKNGPGDTDWQQLVVTGGGSLDSAYDFGGAGAGRTINADSGAVQINALTADGQSALSINRSPTSSAATFGIDLTLGSNTNASGTGFQITDNGAGTSINVNKNGAGIVYSAAMTDPGAQALVIAVNAAPTSAPPVSITANVTGTTATLVAISKVPASSTAGAGLSVSMGANTTGPAITLAAAGTGPALQVSAGTIEMANASAAAVSPANNGRIRYNSSTQTFQVSMNGAAYVDITTGASFTLDIGDAIGSSTVGSVLFVGASNLLAQDNANFFWDNTNKRFGIGTTASPTTTLDVRGTSTSTDTVYIRNYSTTGYSAIQFFDSTDTGRGATGYGNASANDATVQSKLYWRTFGSDMVFTTGVSTPSSVAIYLKNSNNFLGVGPFSSTTSPGARLHVYGTENPTVMRLQSTGAPGFGRMEFYSDPIGSANEWRPGYLQTIDEGSFTGGFQIFSNGTGSGNKFGSVENARFTNGKAAFPVGPIVVGSLTVTKTGFVNEITKDATNNLILSAYGTGVNAEINLFRGRGTGAATTAVLSSDVLGQVAFCGATTSTLFFSGATMVGRATENWSGTAAGSKIETYTTANTTATRVLRTTIDQDGVFYFEGAGFVSKSSSSAAGFFNTAFFAAGGASTSFAQSDRELRVTTGSNSGGQRQQYITFNGRWSGTIDSPTLTQGLYDRVCAIEFNAAADSLGPNPNSSINFIVNTGAKGTGTETTVTPTRAMTITYTARVGIGTTNPSQPFDVEAILGNTNGKFGSSLPIYAISADPYIGYNAYYNSGWKFGKGSVAKYGAVSGLDTGTGIWSLSLASATGNADAAITLVSRLNVSPTGVVSIPALTAGSVPYIGSSGAISENNTSFTWDNPNTQLSIGGSSLSTGYVFSMKKSNGGGALWGWQNTNTTGYTAASTYNATGTFVGSFGYANPSATDTSKQDKWFLRTESRDFNIESGGDGTTQHVFGSTANSVFYQLSNGSSAAVSAGNSGRIRYTTFGQKFQASLNGAAYVDLLTSTNVSGTTGRLAKFTGANTVGDTQVTESGNTIVLSVDDAGSHANRPQIIVTNSTLTGAFAHRAEITLNAADSGGTLRAVSILAEAGNLTISPYGSTTFTNGVLMNGQANATNLLATNNFAGQTNGFPVISGRAIGSYDTTAISLLVAGVWGEFAGSRSAGANDLTGIGVNGVASGAQINVGVNAQANGAATVNYGLAGSAFGGTTNWALYTDQGDVALNATNGITRIGPTSGTTAALAMNGGSTAAVSSSGSGRLIYNEVSNKFQVSLNGAAYVDVATGSGGGTVSGTTGKIAKFTGATAVGDSLMSESGSAITLTAADAGSNANRPNLIITNSTTTGAVAHQAEITLNAADAGNVSRAVSLLAEAGNLTVTPYGTTTFNNAVLMNGQANATNLLATSNFAGQTNGFPVISGRAIGSYDTTVGFLLVAGVWGEFAGSRSAGGNPLAGIGVNGVAAGAQQNVGVNGQANGAADINYGLAGTAYGGTTNYALYTDQGDVLLNNTSGTTTVQGATTVNNKVTQKAHANFAGSGKVMTTAAVQTTDATQTTVFTLTLPDTSDTFVEARVTGRDTAGTERALYGKIALVYREGGGATIQGSVQDVFPDIETSAGLDATITVSSNDVRVSVTGLAATTINWVASVTYQTVSGSA